MKISDVANPPSSSATINHQCVECRRSYRIVDTGRIHIIRNSLVGMLVICETPKPEPQKIGPKKLSDQLTFGILQISTNNKVNI